MKKKALISAMVAAAALGASVSAQAAGGDWLLRVHGMNLAFDNGQNSLPVRVEADDRVIPEFDFSYFITDNFAMELVLTYPQTVDIAVGGAHAGSVKALPPTLLAQYHFTTMGAFKPYLGAGLNLTLFSSRDNILAGAAKVDSSSVGLAVQAGFDYSLNEKWSLNADLKYIQMNTGVTVTGSKIGTLDLNPTAISLGFGYKLN